MISFACLAPHPPIILPDIGSPEDRAKTQKTINALSELGNKLRSSNPDKIIISSPHTDWGFSVPLYFLSPKKNIEFLRFVTGSESCREHFEKGIDYWQTKIAGRTGKFALIGSGDMSHVLKEDGPYGLRPDGEKFDNALLEALNNKDMETIFKLNEQYPEAAECGLRSFCFILGILEGAKKKWSFKLYSYEAPFGVGYMAAELLF